MTESGLMQDTEPTTAILLALKKLGVQIAIDDFGTGYSSLSYMLRFPIDTLKIDRSFVQDLDDDTVDTGDAGEAIVSAVIAMGTSLKQRVVAEGDRKHNNNWPSCNPVTAPRDGLLLQPARACRWIRRIAGNRSVYLSHILYHVSAADETEEPGQRHGTGVIRRASRSPHRSESQPRMEGEKASPRAWMKKMLTAKAMARIAAG